MGLSARLVWPRYVLRRLALMVPTLLGIVVLNFAVVQSAPGGPVERAIAELEGEAGDPADRLMGSGSLESVLERDVERRAGREGRYRGAEGLDPKTLAEIERRFGFDRPWHERLLGMLRRYATFDFGESFFRARPVWDLVLERLPVSVSLGLWTTLLTYLVSIPLGIHKARVDGTRFDTWTSVVIVVGTAVPGFLVAVLLLSAFGAGGSFPWFPLRGLSSDGAESWPLWQRALDYLWHVTLPVASLAVGGFATLTLLTKHSFVDQLGQNYVLTARAKGISERRVLYGHVFRNAMLIVVAGFPQAFFGALISGAVLVEVIFSLEGLGLLGFDAAFQRDYPVMFGTLYLFSLLGLVLNLLSDLTYALVDPRIDFDGRAT